MADIVTGLRGDKIILPSGPDDAAVHCVSARDVISPILSS